MEKKQKFNLSKIKAILQENGYTISSGIQVGIFEAAATCGTITGSCTGGCNSGCYTCSTGTSKKTTQVIQPTIQLGRENILDDILTIRSNPVDQKE